MAENKQSIIIVKKVEGGGHGHHGGAWKVAYADFVTAMMAFFLVMWLLGSDEEVASSAASYFNAQNELTQPSQSQNNSNIGGDPSMLKGLDGQIPDELVELPQIPFSKPMPKAPEYDQQLKDLVHAANQGKNLKIQALTFTVPETMIFKGATDRISPEGFDYLKNLARIIRNFKGPVKVHGFTLPYFTPETGLHQAYDQALNRVVAVMAYFTLNKVIEEDRIQPKIHNSYPKIETVTKRDRILQFSLGS